ncbi:MAG: OmpA family protein [Verrucomicrobiota bacterium]
MSSVLPRFILALPLALLLGACEHMPKLPKFGGEQEPNVVFALGTRDGFKSPLEGALKPACPALQFENEGYSLTGAHKKALAPLIADWSKAKPRYLIAGHTPPGLPEDFARSLSERRAQAVRQHLIESGIEAANLQTVGYGYDTPPTSNVVVIYQQL